MSADQMEILTDKITGYLAEMELPTERTHQDLFLFRFGSTVVMISLFQQHQYLYVRIASTLLRDFRPNLELVTRLLRLNSEVLLGSFLLFEDDILSFSVTLPAENLSSSLFKRSLSYVAHVSDTYDDELQSIAGGLKASDIMNQDQP